MTDKQPSPEKHDTLSERDELHRRVADSVEQLQDVIDHELAGDLLQPTPVPASLTPPESLAESGLSQRLVRDLILKFVYLHGQLTGYELSKRLHVPFSVIDEVLDFLKSDRCLEVHSGDMMGRISYRFQLTEHGRSRARQAFDDCRYLGPAPVTLEQYADVTRQQAVRFVAISEEKFRSAFDSLVIDDELIKTLGAAVASGLSIFLYGPPGNGKTIIARALGRFLNEHGGSIYIPYALVVDQHIITLFDPSIHSAVAVDSQAEWDQRWRVVKRPVVISGGELTLGMLDLSTHSEGDVITAPLHIKANGGVFLLDDFGRQLVDPRQLLNRWILPLEEGHDYLTLPTGKKFAIPFEQLILFSTNIPPQELVDQAFLRRIRHKIEISYPSEDAYRQIFKMVCQQRGIKYDDWIVSHLLTNLYTPQIPPKSSDPRDLLDVIEGICRFSGHRAHLSEELVCAAFQKCLGGPNVSR